MPLYSEKPEREADIAALAAKDAHSEQDAKLADIPMKYIGARTRSMWYTLAAEQKEVLISEALERMAADK